MIIQRCSLNSKEGTGYQFRHVTTCRSGFASYMNGSFRGYWDSLEEMLSLEHKIITENV